MCNQKEEQDGNTNKRTVLEVRGPINLVGSRVHVSAADEVKNRWERHLGEARTVNMTIQHFIITYTRRFNYTRAIERWLILSPGTANFGLLGFEFIRLKIRRRAPCAKSRKIYLDTSARVTFLLGWMRPKIHFEKNIYSKIKHVNEFRRWRGISFHPNMKEKRETSRQPAEHTGSCCCPDPADSL